MEPSDEAAFGIAAWAVTKHLLSGLRMRGIVSQEQGDEIIACSLDLVRALQATAQSRAFEVAREELERWTKEWRETERAHLEPTESPPP